MWQAGKLVVGLKVGLDMAEPSACETKENCEGGMATGIHKAERATLPVGHITWQTSDLAALRAR